MPSSKYNIDISINARARKAREEVEKLSKSFGGLRDVLGKVGIGLGIIEATRMLVDFTKKIAAAGGEAEAALRKFNLVFGSSAQEGLTWADNISKSFGIANANVLRMAASIQDTFVPLGSTRQEAALLSQTAVELAVNLGRFEGLRTGDVLNDIRSAAIGNWETMKKYGTILTDTVIKERAREWGLKNITVQLDSQLAAIIRMHKMLEDTADANQDLEGSAALLTTRIDVMKNSFESSAQTLGQEFKPELKSTTDAITASVNVFTDLAVKGKNMWDSFRDSVEDLKKSEHFVERFAGEMNTIFFGVSDAIDKMGEGVRETEKLELQVRKAEMENRNERVRNLDLLLKKGKITEEQHREQFIALYNINQQLEEQNELNEDGINRQRAIKMLGDERVRILNEQHSTEADISEIKKQQVDHDRKMGRLASKYRSEIDSVRDAYKQIQKNMEDIHGVGEDTAERLAEEEKKAREELLELKEKELELEEEVSDARSERNQLEEDYKYYVEDQESASSKKLDRLQKELQILRTRSDINNRLIKISSKEKEIAALREQLDEKSTRNIEKKKRRMNEIIADNKESIEDKREEIELEREELENRLKLIETERERFGLTEQQVQKAKEYAELSDIEKFVTEQKERQQRLIEEEAALIENTIEKAEKLLSIDERRLVVYKQMNDEKQRENDIYGTFQSSPALPSTIENARSPNTRAASTFGSGKPKPAGRSFGSLQENRDV